MIEINSKDEHLYTLKNSNSSVWYSFHCVSFTLLIILLVLKLILLYHNILTVFVCFPSRTMPVGLNCIEMVLNRIPLSLSPCYENIDIAFMSHRSQSYFQNRILTNGFPSSIIVSFINCWWKCAVLDKQSILLDGIYLETSCFSVSLQVVLLCICHKTCLFQCSQM
jgi:hypothetical protein